MAKGDIYIGTLLVPEHSRTFTQSLITFEKTQRTINNTLVSDVTGFKNKFAFVWENWLDGDFIDYLIDIYIAKEDVTVKIINADLTESEYICQMSISEDRIREWKEDNYAYSGFSITLEEV